MNETGTFFKPLRLGVEPTEHPNGTPGSDIAGLMMNDNGTRLEDRYSIKPCAADPKRERQADDWYFPEQR